MTTQESSAQRTNDSSSGEAASDLARKPLRRQGRNRVAWWDRALCGAVGAVAPDTLLLFSKRFTMPDAHFSPSTYLLAMSLYVAMSAGFAVIFTSERRMAVAMGVGLPTFFSGLVTA